MKTPCNDIGIRRTESGPAKQLSIRMPKETWMRLQRHAAREREHINTVIVRWIEAGLEGMER